MACGDDLLLTAAGKRGTTALAATDFSERALLEVDALSCVFCGNWRGGTAKATTPSERRAAVKIVPGHPGDHLGAMRRVQTSSIRLRILSITHSIIQFVNPQTRAITAPASPRQSAETRISSPGASMPESCIIIMFLAGGTKPRRSGQAYRMGENRCYDTLCSFQTVKFTCQPEILCPDRAIRK